MTNEFNLDTLLSDLKGLGVKELNVPLVIETSSGKQVELKISNIPTSAELDCLLAAEEFKGHQWMQRIKCEVLSRAVTSLNGVTIDSLAAVQDPNNPTETVLVRRALRDLMLTWGPETLQVVWRVFMNHCQNLEDALMASFPEAAVITDYERHFYEKTLKLVDEFAKEMVADDMGLEASPEE